MNQLSYIQDFLKPFSRLFFPMLLGMSGIIILNIVRLILVGNYGVDVVAGVGLANAMIGLVLIVGQGFTSAVNTLHAVNTGAKRYKQIANDFQQTWYLLFLLTAITAVMLIVFVVVIYLMELPDITKDIYAAYSIGFIFTALPIYFIWAGNGILMNMGLSKLSGYIGIVSTLSNSVLQWFVIVGYNDYGGWGPYASPIAMLITLILEAIVIAFVLKGNKKTKHLELYSTWKPKFNYARLKLIIKNGLPIAGSNLGEMCLFSLAGVALATINTKEVAAFEIILTIIEAMLFITLASTNSATLLVGNYLGANKVPNAKFVFYRSLITVSIVIIGLGVVVYIFRLKLGSYFILDPETLNIIANSLVLGVAVQLFNLYNFTSNNSLRAMQDFKYAFVINSIFFILIGTPLNFIVIHIDLGWGPLGTVGSFINFNVMILLSSIFLYNRVRKYFKIPDQQLVDLVNNKVASSHTMNH